MNTDELIAEIRKYDSSFKLTGTKWCRYCGAKASAKWHTINRMIVCEVHSKQYKTDSVFAKKIDRYKKIPRKPIDKSQNMQNIYLQQKLKLIISKQKKLRNPK